MFEARVNHMDGNNVFFVPMAAEEVPAFEEELFKTYI
jgi:hypothetical protein